jgi:hypothetical protein
MSSEQIDDRKWLFTSDASDIRGDTIGKILFANNGASSVNEYKSEKIMDTPLYDLMVAKFYDNRLPNESFNDIHFEFTDFIINTALFHREIDMPSSAEAGYKTLKDDNAYMVYQHVFKNWNQLNEDAKAFYRNFIQLIKVGLGKESGPIHEAEYGNLIQDDYRQFYRLNLIKDRMYGKIKIIEFGKKLPKFNKSIFGNIWYTSKTGDKLYINRDKVDDNFFRDLYHAVYHNKNEKFFEGAEKSYEEQQKEIKELQRQLAFTQGEVATYQKTQEVQQQTGQTQHTTSLLGGGGQFIDVSVFDSFPISFPSTDAKRFSTNVASIVKEKICAIQNASVVEAEPESEMPETVLDMMNKGIWSRDPENPKVFVRTINGKKVKMGCEDDELIKFLKEPHECYGTYVNGNQEQCNKFIFECLMSKDPDSLVKCLNITKFKDFYQVAKTDISNLHPVLALRILQQFGFRKYKEFDETAGMDLWKVECASHWLEHYVYKKYSKETFASMLHDNNQKQILSYLNLVSQYVNSNPSILNKDYQGACDEATGVFKVSEYAKKLSLQPRRDPYPEAPSRYDLMRLRSNIPFIRPTTPFVLTSTSGRVSTPFGMDITPGVGLLRAQVGGGSKCEYIIKKISEGKHVVGANLISKYFNVLNKQLQSKGKKLSDNDYKNIMGRIEKLNKIEDEVLKSMCYIEEYNKLLDVFKDYKAEVLTEDNLKKFVQHQDKLFEKQNMNEGTLLEILIKISNLLDKDAKDSKDYVPIKIGN